MPRLPQTPEQNSEASGPPHQRSRVIESSPVHYGWVVLAASTVGLAMTIPGQTIGVSVFLDRIIDDLDVSRSMVSLTYTIATLVGSLTLPFVGRLVDRRGPQRPVVAIGILFALACAVMGLAQGMLTLLIGFTLIRGLGQGALGLVSTHSINIWFLRRRGLAVGLAGVGFALAAALAPGLIDTLIRLIGWRLAYVALGVIVAVVMIPIGGGLLRDRPERYGLQPDSHRPAPRAPATEIHYWPAEARRTLTFWLYVAGGFLTAALGTGLVFHHYSIMGQSGIERPVATAMFLAYGLALAGSGLVTGFLMDRMPPRFLLAVSQGLMGAAMLAATRITTPAAILIYGAALGTMQGMSQSIQSSVYAHYFGRLHIGTIRGLATTITIAGSAAGPLLLAAGFDIAGTYRPILAAAALAPLAIAAIAPFLRLCRDGRIR